MNRYKIIFYFTDGKYTFVEYDSEEEYQDEFVKQQEIIGRSTWYSFGNNRTKQSINLSNVIYWILEKK